MKCRFALAAGVAVLLAGCGGSGHSPVAMPSVAPMQFTALAKQVLAAAETSEPVAVVDLDIAFADDDNPQAFDDVLPPSP